MLNLRHLAPLVLLGLIACGGSLDISPTALPNAIQNASYSQQITGTGKQPVSFQLTQGSLPPGISLSQGGLLSGTPTTPGASTFTISGEDSNTFGDDKGKRDFTITVIPQLKLNASLPAARAGEPYSFTIVPTGGVPPYTMTSVGLHAGLAFNGSTGTISGTPPTVQSYDITVTATDSGSPQQQTSQQMQLVIRAPGVVISTSSLPDGNVNVAYQEILSTSNGAGPFQWSISDGLLPNGLRLDQSTGEISGTPTQSGESTISITVEDLGSQPDQDTKQFNLTIH